MLHNIFLLILLLSIFGLILSQSYDQDEIKSLKCDVCLNLVDNFIKLSDDARENAPYKKLSELQVVEIIEDICENTSKYGKWIREFIVTPTQGDDNKTYLTIEKQPSLSRCKKDCNVITATCKKILGSLDIDDLSAVAYKRLNLEKAQNKICKSDTNSCKKKVPFTKEFTERPFNPISDEDFDLESYATEMRKKGIPLQTVDKQEALSRLYERYAEMDKNEFTEEDQEEVMSSITPELLKEYQSSGFAKEETKKDNKKNEKKEKKNKKEKKDKKNKKDKKEL